MSFTPRLQRTIQPEEMSCLINSDMTIEVEWAEMLQRADLISHIQAESRQWMEPSTQCL
jgi:hypothetical protein